MLEHYDKKTDFTYLFYDDNQFKYPYYDGITRDGLFLTFLVPKEVKIAEIRDYVRKLKNERDIVGFKIIRR